MKDNKNKLSQLHNTSPPISSNNPIINGAELMSIENDLKNTYILPNNLVIANGILPAQGGRYGQIRGRKINRP